MGTSVFGFTWFSLTTLLVLSLPSVKCLPSEICQVKILPSVQSGDKTKKVSFGGDDWLLSSLPGKTGKDLSWCSPC